MRHRYLKSLGLLLPSLLAVASTAEAAPIKRVQFDLRGDFIVAGNTLGQDCDPAVPTPLIGTVSNCGTNVIDADGAAIDVLWRREADGSFVANQTVLPSQARSRSYIDLGTPNTGSERKVRYARLYWSGFSYEACPGTSPSSASCVDQIDTTATLIGPNGVSNNLTAPADSQWVQDGRYQASADVTDIVRVGGTGGWDVTGVDSFKPFNLQSGDVYAGWSMIIVYENPVESLRNITLFDGFEYVRRENSTNFNASGTISGFKVPSGTGFDAKLGVVAFEGDQSLKGDVLKFNNTILSNGQNPNDNTFNGTRSNLGNALTNVNDRPQLSGAPLSMGGVDFDVFNIKPQLAAGATSANFEASTSGDFYFISSFVTSIATLAPDIAGVKTVKDINGGTTLPGDELEYKIVITNNGSDNAINSVFTDPLPNGVTYVPGTLKIDATTLSDSAGNDQGEVTGNAPQNVVVRPFTGATAGVLEQNKTTTITFRVKINATFSGTLTNQAKINAAGQNGDPAFDYFTDGLQSEPGNQGTTITVEICDATSTGACPSTKPLCDTSTNPNQCVACLGDADCPNPNAPLCDQTTHACTPCTTDAACATKDPTKPACDESGACVVCTDTNEAQCKGTTPACDDGPNTCVQCTDNSDCKLPTAVCDTTTNKCVQCLTANDCPGPSACSAATKTCVSCITSTDCAGVTPICENTTCTPCDNDAECKTKNPSAPVCAGTGECVTCTPGNDDACPADKPVCSTSNVCVACTQDSECTGGKKCDVASNTCVGCTSSNDCPTNTPICNATTQTCGTCKTDTECAGKDPNLPVCLDSGLCGECDADSKGKCNDDKPLCNETTNTCVGCETSADCTKSGALVCDPKDKTCVECASSADCKGGTPICDTKTRTCVGCENDAECNVKSPTSPFCQKDKGECVACLPDQPASCKTGVCDAGSNTCVDCNADEDCKDPKKPACNTGKKTCVECTESNDDACKGEKPTCDTGSNTCVGCNADSECNGDTPVCDTKAHTCVACKSDEECAKIDPKNPVCGENGACVACTPDNTDACDEEAPKCNPDSFQCVECVEDGDCNDAAKPECSEGTCKPGSNAGGTGGAAGKGGGSGKGGSDDEGGAAGAGGADRTGDIVIAGGACSYGPSGNAGSNGLLALAGGFVALVASRRRKQK